MEIWKETKCSKSYQVSNLGMVKNIKTGRILKQQIDTKGYLKVNLFTNKKPITVRVHRLVADCFLINIENKKEVNHINKNKQDNRVENLEWVHRNENIFHKNNFFSILIKKQIEKMIPIES